MGSQQPTARDLAAIFGNPAQLQSAKAGGYGGHPILSMITSGLAAAFPRGPLPQALNAMMQTSNLNAFGRTMQEQYENVRGDRVAMGSKLGLPTDYKGYADIPDAATLANMQNLTYQNDPDGLQSFLDTGKMNTVQGGILPQFMVEGAMNRAKDVMNNQATMRQLPQFMSPPIPGGVLPANPNMPALQANPGVLQVGAQKTQPVTPGEAFTYGVPNIDQLLSGRENEQTDRRGNRTIDETTRSNQAEEKLKRDIHNATVANKGGYAKYAPVGGGGSSSQMNPQTAAMQALQAGLITPEQYAQTLGVKSGPTKTPGSKELTYMDTLYKAATPDPGGVFGWGARPANPQAAAKYNALARQYGLPEIGPTFGNRAQANLKQAGQFISPSDWKKGKR